LIQEGRYEEAVPILRRAVESFPAGSRDLNYAYALYNLGQALRLAGQPEEAVPILERRLEIPNQRGTVKRELEAARAQVAELAASKERLRISRDLHDLLGHNLSVVALKSQLAQRLLGRDPGAAEDEMRDVESVARTSLQEARAAVQDLRSASLTSELDRAREALAAAGIEARVRGTQPLPTRVETLLGFAAREGATNVIRHSRAHRCEVAAREVGDVAELEVRDDGVGSAGDGDGGSGLRGLAERLAEAGGTLDAGPAPGGGFRLIARVPLSPAPRPEPDHTAQPVTAER
jgi:two-component system sensor histidine kinase DesK